MATATTTSAPVHKNQSAFKTLLGTGVGNALEWFDWNVYAAFAIYFSAQFFDKTDRASAFLSTMAVFAVGFVARPFGSYAFGWLADRIGRRESLSGAVLCAAAGSLLIALSPTYEQVGVFASAILVFARLLQGLAHGGELPAAQTYLSEHAPAQRRGLWASSIYVTGTLGVLGGMVTGLVLNALLTKEQMFAWGWRVPFVMGAIFGLFALWMRLRMNESEIFEEAKKTRDPKVKKENILVGVVRNWRTGLQVMGMTCGLTVAYYVWSVTMPSLAQNSFGYDADAAFTASIVGNVVFLLALPVWGWVSDIWGRKPTMLVATLGIAVAYVPLLHWVAKGQSEFALIIAISVQLMLLAAFVSHAPATYAEMFSTDQRATGFGIPHALTIALFGGTAGYVLTWMGNPSHFAWYSITLLVVSALTILTLPETKGVELDY